MRSERENERDGKKIMEKMMKEKKKRETSRGRGWKKQLVPSRLDRSFAFIIVRFEIISFVRIIITMRTERKAKKGSYALKCIVMTRRSKETKFGERRRERTKPLASVILIKMSHIFSSHWANGLRFPCSEPISWLKSIIGQLIEDDECVHRNVHRPTLVTVCPARSVHKPNRQFRCRLPIQYISNQ